MARRLLNRLAGRVHGWFDSKEARVERESLPAKFSSRARLALQDLEDRSVPATFTVTTTADSGAGSLREAFMDGERLDRVLLTTTSGALPPRAWLAELFIAPSLTTQDRAALLIGRAPGRAADTSPVVCACRNVRGAAIARAIAAGAHDVDAVSDATGAGSSCGSCRPEIARILSATPRTETLDAA